MQYDSQIKKLLKMLQGETQNTIDQDDLTRTKQLPSPESTQKKLVVVPLIVGYDFQNGVFDPSANNGNGGYIADIVTIVEGGPNNIVS